MRRIRLAAFVTGTYPTILERSFVNAPMDIAASLCRGLSERGHQVDYYAPNGSQIDGNLITLGLDPLSEFGVHLPPDDQGNEDASAQLLWDHPFLEEMFRRAHRGDYDLMHIHPIARAMPLCRVMPFPSVFTIHDPLWAWMVESLRQLSGPQQHLVAISHSQRTQGADLRFAATIPHGIDTNHFRFSAAPEDTLLFAGRVCPAKGVKEAVELALATGQRLTIVGPVAEKDRAYFERHVQPHLGEDIVYRGHVCRSTLPSVYGKAKALLNPLQWDEPFGLTMVEAMSCGTPVLALRRGSAAEVINQGITGYAAESLEELEALLRDPSGVSALDRGACRRWVQEHFSEERMIDEYEKLFLDIAATSG